MLNDRVLCFRVHHEKHSLTKVKDDNTKPSVRMGRKAYWVSRRQPGRRNITRYSAPGFFIGVSWSSRSRRCYL